MARVLAFIVAWLACAGQAWAENRIALIVANSDYQTTGWDLANPANDAVLMQRSLAAVGFEVNTVLHASRIDLDRAFQEHGKRLKRAGPNSTGFFFYAGHGVQSEGF